MFAKVFAPIPLAIAAAVAGVVGVEPCVAAEAKPAFTSQEAMKRFVLKTGLAEGKLVFLDPQGKTNPTLHASVGDTVEITYDDRGGRGRWVLRWNRLF